MPEVTPHPPAEVVIYTWGLVCCSVCAPMGLTIAEIETSVNRQLPTGVGPWLKSEAETFRSGDPNPCPCEHDGSRVHYLLNC